MMYIKEDLIIPHVCDFLAVVVFDRICLLWCVLLQHHTFYEFIVTQARGKSGQS